MEVKRVHAIDILHSSKTFRRNLNKFFKWELYAKIKTPKYFRLYTLQNIQPLLLLIMSV